ncbi:hypothetical protein HDU93_005472 [Gonapodya sp. JEL0774]|nr:hypothetical protein HDU93_005472 [Gonapodya sp. JEL0774]
MTQIPTHSLIPPISAAGSRAVKLSKDSVTRKVAIDRDAEWADVEGQIKLLFRLPPTASFTLVYKDDDGDSVSLASTSELRDLLFPPHTATLSADPSGTGVDVVRFEVHVDGEGEGTGKGVGGSEVSRVTRGVPVLAYRLRGSTELNMATSPAPTNQPSTTVPSIYPPVPPLTTLPLADPISSPSPPASTPAPLAAVTEFVGDGRSGGVTVGDAGRRDGEEARDGGGDGEEFFEGVRRIGGEIGTLLATHLAPILPTTPSAPSHGPPSTTPATTPSLTLHLPHSPNSLSFAIPRAAFHPIVALPILIAAFHTVSRAMAAVPAVLAAVWMARRYGTHGRGGRRGKGKASVLLGTLAPLSLVLFGFRAVWWLVVPIVISSIFSGVRGMKRRWMRRWGPAGAGAGYGGYGWGPAQHAWGAGFDGRNGWEGQGQGQGQSQAGWQDGAAGGARYRGRPWGGHGSRSGSGSGESSEGEWW